MASTALRRNNDHELDPATVRLFEEERERRTAGLVGRERRIEFALAYSFLAAALAAELFLNASQGFSVGIAIVSVAAFAIAARVKFYVGTGWGTPTQLVFVPMLFLLPTPAVPLLIALGLVLAKAPECLSGKERPNRMMVAVGDAWYTLGPVLVLSLAGSELPVWSDWPIYVAALAAQFAFDFAVSTLQARFGLGIPVRTQLNELLVVWSVDALLAPVGLLAAFASSMWQYGFLLVLPMVGLLAIFAQERMGRMENALTLSRAYRGTALLLGELLTAGDAYTGDHSRTVVVLSQTVGRRLGLDERALRDLEFAALLHDVGKLAVPKEILNKPGPLTPDEFEVMKRHVEEGQLMLEKIGGVMGDAGHVVRTHHERFDGAGYPDGLAGTEIPLAARIIACCDAFNAMTTDRPYRRAMSRDEAIAELRSQAGRQFDPHVVEILCETIATGEPRPANENSEPGAAPAEQKTTDSLPGV
jgi:HD-GYP domain-containing protein (c-di-GMP phosphodiesterase class II)